MDFDDGQDTMYPSTSSSSPYPYRSPAIGRPSLLPVGSLYTTETEGFDAKVVVMGNSAVGKTSLLQRFANNDFNPSSTKATTGALFVTKKVLVDGLKVRLQLWDTAGQERFRSMAPMYYRGANAAILCYDVTDPSSFADIRIWLEELKHHHRPPPTPSTFNGDNANNSEESQGPMLIYIVGAKADLAPPSSSDEPLGRVGMNASIDNDESGSSANHPGGAGHYKSQSHTRPPHLYTSATGGSRRSSTKTIGLASAGVTAAASSSSTTTTNPSASSSSSYSPSASTSSPPSTSFPSSPSFFPYTGTKTKNKKQYITRQYAKRQLHTWFPPAPLPNAKSSAAAAASKKNTGTGGSGSGSGRPTVKSLPGNSTPPAPTPASTDSAVGGLSYIRPRFMSLTSMTSTLSAPPLPSLTPLITSITAASSGPRTAHPLLGGGGGGDSGGHTATTMTTNVNGKGRPTNRYHHHHQHHHHRRPSPSTSPDPSPSSRSTVASKPGGMGAASVGLARASSARVVPVGTRIGNMSPAERPGAGYKRTTTTMMTTAIARGRGLRERRWSDAMLWDDESVRERGGYDDGGDGFDEEEQREGEDSGETDDTSTPNTPCLDDYSDERNSPFFPSSPSRSPSNAPSRPSNSRSSSFRSSSLRSPRSVHEEEEEDNDNDDEREDDEDEFRLEPNTFLFEVSAKTSAGIDDLFDHLISSLVKRSESIRREKAQRERNSVFLGDGAGAGRGEGDRTSVKLGSPAAAKAARGGWGCCST